MKRIRTTLPSSNRRRRRRLFQRNYGARAAAVRAMPCLLAGRHQCTSPVRACHSRARGMGGAKGDRRELWPGCDLAHSEAGERPGLGRYEGSQRQAFERRYQIDIEEEAARIAALLDERGYE